MQNPSETNPATAAAEGPCANPTCGCGPECQCGSACVCTPDANCAE